MIFAMMSIGLLGFLVWAQMMGFLYCKIKVINFAICWNLFWLLSPWIIKFNGKILKVRQSAGNFSTLKGSSETIRKISYFKNYEGFQPQQIKNINENFLCWFIGFIEGDGSFGTNGKKNYFQIRQKDPKVLYYIKKNLGFGQVIKKKDGYFIFRVRDQVNIDRLIKIFYGNLQLKKTQERFYKWIEVYKNYTKLDSKLSLDINFPSKNLINLNNAWLSGFIDAEGSFNVILEKSNNIYLRFIIDQKNESEILKKIFNLFNFNLKIQDRKELENMQRIIIGITYIDILFKYLTQFPLKSNKIISYKRFKRIYNYKLLSKEKYNKIINNPKALLKLKNLIKSINNHNLE